MEATQIIYKTKLHDFCVKGDALCFMSGSEYVEILFDDIEKVTLSSATSKSGICILATVDTASSTTDSKIVLVIGSDNPHFFDVVYDYLGSNISIDVEAAFAFASEFDKDKASKVIFTKQ